MTKQNLKKSDPQHPNEFDGLDITNDEITSRGGLLLVLKVFRSLRLRRLADIFFWATR